MINRIKTIVLALAISIAGFTAVGMGVAVASTPGAIAPQNFAAFKDSACSGLRQVDPGQTCAEGATKVDNLVARLVNLLSYIVGIVAVIFIIVAGFKYITSGGDAAKVSAAKMALIYALIGLLVAAIAQFLVRLVFSVSKQA